MARPRRFDHDEALRLFTEEGWAVPVIARRMGVSDASVRIVCDSGYRARCRESNRKSQARGRCVDCGGVCNFRSARCRECYVANLRENRVHGTEGAYKRCKCGPCRAAATRGRQRRRLNRAVPCARCGKPRLDHRDGGRGRDTGLCAPCYWEELRRTGGIAARKVAA